MGYAAMIYTVDLDALRRVVAEHDLSVLEPIKSSDPDEFEDRFDDEEPTRGEALEAILRGAELDPDVGHQYGYALKSLCEHLGEFVEDFVELESLELDSLLAEGRLPIDIPPSDDFPFIGYLTADETRAEVERLKTIDLAHPDEDLAEDRRAFAECIRATAEKGLALISFYH